VWVRNSDAASLMVCIGSTFLVGLPSLEARTGRLGARRGTPGSGLRATT
jgi:hypothetical protein